MRSSLSVNCDSGAGAGSKSVKLEATTNRQGGEESTAGIVDSGSIEGPAVSSYFLPGKIGWKTIHCLLDTGCTANVLSKVVLERLPRHLRDKVQPITAQGILADGSQLLVVGRIKLQGKLRDVPFEDDFLIGHIKEDVILGVPLLENHYEFRHVYTVHEGKILMCTDRFGNQLASKVQVVRQITVPPWAEMIIKDCLLLPSLIYAWRCRCY